MKLRRLKFYFYGKINRTLGIIEKVSDIFTSNLVMTGLLLHFYHPISDTSRTCNSSALNSRMNCNSILVPCTTNCKVELKICCIHGSLSIFFCFQVLLHCTIYSLCCTNPFSTYFVYLCLSLKVS